MTNQVLDDIIARLEPMAKKDREKAAQSVQTFLKNNRMAWIPNPGPQTEAYNSKADVLLYGGQAGGGKSELLLGLAFNAHSSSLIMRRQYTDLGAITQRAIEINGTRNGFNGSAPPKLQTITGRKIDFGAAAHVGDEESWQGQPHSLLGIDEGAQFAESQVRFLFTWLRSVTPEERCRCVIATNPPLSAEGDWLITMFAPWLDPVHHNPAKPGEMRWFITDEDGKDREVPGSEPVLTGDRLVRPMSRTFIPASVDDNPFLASTDYRSKLDGLPEPYRSAFRDGNFMVGRKDADDQIIPSEWVRAAQMRWRPNPPTGVPMCAIGVDVAAGGDDQTVLAPRYDGWFAPLVAIPGRETPFGSDTAGHVLRHRRDDALVVIDMGGGYGGSTYEHLKANGIPVKGYKGASGTKERTADRQLGFYNERARTYWRFREALDPGQLGGSRISLPDDPELAADLCAVRQIRPDHASARGIQLETKEDLVKRLNRSTDKGDAVVMSYSQGARASTDLPVWQQSIGHGRAAPRVVMGHEAARRRF